MAKREFAKRYLEGDGTNLVDVLSVGWLTIAESKSQGFCIKGESLFQNGLVSMKCKVVN